MWWREGKNQNSPCKVIWTWGKLVFCLHLTFPSRSSSCILSSFLWSVLSNAWDARRICRPHARRICRPHYTDYTHNPFHCFPITIYVVHSLARVLDAHRRIPYGVIVVRQSTQINNSLIIHELFTNTLSCTTVQWAFAGNVDRELTHRNYVVGSLGGVIVLGLFLLFLYNLSGKLGLEKVKTWPTLGSFVLFFVLSWISPQKLRET